ncbi:putative adenylyltransferase/sulfurtransferase MoeZ [Stieleria maiorica]|uniref:Putative adenylyltransferase/sulfurtransferase MoeZ n=1 Tax=Stieleria maiorica TaxID=2795974 RepID=A0A5B9M8E8_9BACT|nr:rhodanese-like domain-containing protein [Stieleria maiorica]QEF97441.1 putative adenylyltransferase/sulfurtransferase MoeZ [Stieleria maiorica]
MSSDYSIEIDVQSVKQLQDSDESFLLLDVRQPEEHATAKIDGSVLIPMGELGQRLDELEPHREGRIVVHCHHGGRSMQVTEALRSRGFDSVQNMAGGIDAWSLQIDGSVPRY